MARVIEAAAMANDKKRGELIAKEIEEVNRQVQSAEISSLDLDRFVAETVEAAAEEPAPLTLPELERTLVKSSAFRERFEPHPDIAGAHLFDWHGVWQAVTFNPELFDEHPNTLKLMTYGSQLLEEALAAVDPPDEGGMTGNVVRCAIDAPWPMVGYYDTHCAKPLPSLQDLHSALDQKGPAELAEEQRESLTDQFNEATQRLLSRDSRAVNDRQKAHVSSLSEEVRQLLAQAAYIELAIAANRDLFDELLPVDFSEQAYERLKRHKVPFAGALRLVGDTLPRPRPDHPFYVRIRNSQKDVLTRRFDATRSKLTDRLQELVIARQAGSSPPPQAESLHIRCYSAHTVESAHHSGSKSEPESHQPHFDGLSVL